LFDTLAWHRGRIRPQQTLDRLTSFLGFLNDLTTFWAVKSTQRLITVLTKLFKSSYHYVFSK